MNINIREGVHKIDEEYESFLKNKLNDSPKPTEKPDDIIYVIDPQGEYDPKIRLYSEQELNR